jgi:hypothetical protein
MSSGHSTAIDRHDLLITSSRESTPTSLQPTDPPIVDAFTRLRKPKANRDSCKRPYPFKYSILYDPYNGPSEPLPEKYSPYDVDQPLFDDRPMIIARLPHRHSEAPPGKRGRNQWTWKVGYALIDELSKGNPLIWQCKLCTYSCLFPNYSANYTFLGHHDEAFSRGKESRYHGSTLKNVERHLREVHYLDEGGDTWRKRSVDKEAGQSQSDPSGATGYRLVQPFRRQAFKNAFIEYVLLDNLSHRQAASKRLERCFKLANPMTQEVLPDSPTTMTSWIKEIFEDCKPELIREIAGAKSKISISFDGWMSKNKLSLIGVCVHFMNAEYKVVTRLLGLPLLPDHGKRGVGELVLSFLLSDADKMRPGHCDTSSFHRI